ncbi:MAG: glycosyltransferase family 4 protein [Chthoniobacter sp.]|nr:glycosyltransferase family 4 protein [Chthoniobacter sp.]
MKILVLCYEYPPLGGGGGRVAQSIAEQMVARGHEVRVQTAALGWRSVHECIGGVEVFRTASGRRAPDTCRVHEMAAYCATSFLPTLRHIRAWHPDVIHAHFAMPTGLLAWAVHRLTGVPYVLTAHLGDVPGGVPEQTDTLFKFIGPIARRVWSRAAAATAVSSFVQELAERAYGRKVVRILNGIDLGDESVKGQAASVSEQPHFVFVGRFSEQKQPRVFTEALAQLHAEPWLATMIGDGPHRPAVEESIARHGLGERVRLTGWLDAPTVQRVLAQADALVMPSLSEGLPVAAIEALKHGLAIIASDIPGMRDVLADGVNGRVFPVGDTGMLATQLGSLLADRPALLAMKRASREKARTFDLPRITDEYEEVLQSVCGLENRP